MLYPAGEAAAHQLHNLDKMVRDSKNTLRKSALHVFGCRMCITQHCTGVCCYDSIQSRFAALQQLEPGRSVAL